MTYRMPLRLLCTAPWLAAVCSLAACSRQTITPIGEEPPVAATGNQPETDTTAPTFLRFEPTLHTSLQVQQLGAITLVFSEPVTLADGSKITLTRASAAVATSLTQNGSSLALTPESPWQEGDYVVTIASGAVQDAAGNPFSGSVQDTFSVTDTLAPVASLRFPSAGASNVGPISSAVIVFSEVVQPTSVGTVTVTRNGAPVVGVTQTLATTLTVTFAAPLPSRGDYVITVPAGLKDAKGNTSTMPTTLAFSTTSAHVGFVSSTTGTGNFSSWAGAGGATGLPAADNVCQALATAQGLPGTFVALASDQANDAYCRIHGFSGKRANNCGRAELPSNAGPWVTPLGTPLLSIAAIDEGFMLGALLLTESGAAATNNGVFTATDAGGVLNPSTASPCSNWTATPSSAVGAALVGYGSDLGGATRQCSQTDAVLCLRSGSGAAVPTAQTTYARPAKRAFVSSATGGGDLSQWPLAAGATGLTAADTICRSLASSAGLANASRFKAWLSSLTISAASRMSSDGPWVRTDGALVAETLADLTDGANLSALSTTEMSTYVSTNVWTGTIEDGTSAAATDTCDDWSSTNNMGVTGRVGRAIAANDKWTNYDGRACNNSFALYCFED